MAALFVGGCAWGSTLVPLIILHNNHVVSLLATGATAVGLGFILSLLAPVRRWALAFGSGALATSLGGIAAIAPSLLPFAVMDIAGLSAIFLAYSYAAIGSQRQSARLLVDNTRLGEGLGESLVQMQKLALCDALTGLPNRRALFEYIEQLDRTRARAVILVDIDHFKRINDGFGHAMGDEVLERAGNAIAATLAPPGRLSGFAARIGGEEFAIVLDDWKNESDAICAATELRQAISASTSAGGDIPEVTASAGVARWDAGEPFDDALGRADAALYRAKSGGRDKTMT